MVDTSLNLTPRPPSHPPPDRSGQALPLHRRGGKGEFAPLSASGRGRGRGLNPLTVNHHLDHYIFSEI